MKRRNSLAGRWGLENKDLDQQPGSYDLGDHILHGKPLLNARLRQLTGRPHRHYNTRGRQRHPIHYLFSLLRCPCLEHAVVNSPASCARFAADEESYAMFKIGKASRTPATSFALNSFGL